MTEEQKAKWASLTDGELPAVYTPAPKSKGVGATPLKGNDKGKEGAGNLKP